MTISAHMGYAQGAFSGELAIQAARYALNQAKRRPIVFGLVIASHHHPYPLIMNGISSLLGDIPLFGFSTIYELYTQGLSHHAVIVVLFSTDTITARADYWPGYSENPGATAQQLIQSFSLDSTQGTLLLAADGYRGDAGQLCTNLPAGDNIIAGGLSGGNLQTSTTYQIGGHQAGTGGMAAALLTGRLTTAVGQACGWQPIGKFARVTASSGCRIHTLNDRAAVDVYADFFSLPAPEWQSYPLNELIHLYPLGIEQIGTSTLLVRSPLRVEKDGSLLMNSSITPGSTAHLLIGSQDSCQKAARVAANRALTGLDSARPFFGLVLVDMAWQMMFESQPGLEIKTLRDVLGPDLLLVGGYTYGQIYGTGEGIRSPELYNQHLQLILFAEKQA